MSIKDNVLPFNARTDTPPGAKGLALPPLVRSARISAEKQISPLLGKLFNQIDDALFDLANKAENNTLQASYFDTMREVRLRKTAILEKLATQLQHEFLLVLEGDADGPDEPQLLELSLIDNTSLEEDIAIRNMADKAAEQYADALYCLQQRVHVAVHGEPPADSEGEEANPFAPRVLCEAFRAAIHVVNMDITARLVIYKLFEKHVMRHLESAYAVANQALANGGLLPELAGRPQASSIVRIPARSRRGGAAVSAGEGDVATTGQIELTGAQLETFELLQQLLAAQRSVTTEATEGVTSEESGGLSAADVLASLSALQGRFDGLPVSDNGESLNLRGRLQQQMKELGAGGMSHEFNQNHADIIDVVGMMFDFILDDPELPDAIKGLLARLQIPMLKVALLDRDFFGRKSHPARRLLNELAKEGMELAGHAEITTLPAYTKIEEIIQRILQEFDDELGIFETLLQDLFEFQNQEEDMLQEMQQALEKSLEESLQAAKEAIQPLLQVEVMPEAIRRLLLGKWQDWLVELYRDREGKSEAWDHAVALAKNLTDSLQPKDAPMERRALTVNLPSLLVDLRRSPVIAGLPPDESREFFSTLEACHLEAMRAPGELLPEQAAPLPSQPSVVPSGGKSLFGDLGKLLGDLPLPGRPAQRPAAPPAPAKPDMPAPVEEIVLSSGPSSGNRQEDLQLGLEYASHAAAVRELKVGTWLNFNGGEGDVLRAKLGWKNVEIGEYVFVDRYMSVVRKASLQELVREFAEERISQVEEEAPLMDRALGSVMSALQKYRDKMDGQQGTPPPAV